MEGFQAGEMTSFNEGFRKIPLTAFDCILMLSPHHCVGKELEGAGVRVEGTWPLRVVQKEGMQLRPGEMRYSWMQEPESTGQGVRDAEKEEGAAKRTPDLGRERAVASVVFAGGSSFCQERWRIQLVLSDTLVDVWGLEFWGAHRAGDGALALSAGDTLGHMSPGMVHSGQEEAPTRGLARPGFEAPEQKLRRHAYKRMEM